MAVFVLSFLIFGLAMGAMAVGALAGRAPIKGSCGGMGALGIDTTCEICGGVPRRCDEETRNGEVGRKNSGQFYPAD